MHAHVLRVRRRNHVLREFASQAEVCEVVIARRMARSISARSMSARQSMRPAAVVLIYAIVILLSK